jgi:hypothetical protein
VSRKQTSEQFSGSYEKDELKITVSGKMENDRPVLAEITVQEGKESKKYTKLSEVPAQHRTTIQQHLMPSSGNGLPLLKGFPMLPSFPGIPGIDD